MDDYWEQQGQVIKNHEAPLRIELLDEEQQEKTNTERMTPEGQINIKDIFLKDLVLKCETNAGN